MNKKIFVWFIILFLIISLGYGLYYYKENIYCPGDGDRVGTQCKYKSGYDEGFFL